MISITINNPDGSLYWREYFNNIALATKWLDEEKTRPYWKKDFVVQIDDRTAEIEAAEIAARQSLESKKNKLKEFLVKPTKSAKDIEDFLITLADYLGIK